MHRRPALRPLLALALCAGLLATNARTPASAAPPPLCQWTGQLPFWLESPFVGSPAPGSPVPGLPLPVPTATPTPLPTQPPHAPVQYAPLPAAAFEVLVDQPTGTVFALSDHGAYSVSSSSTGAGLLSVLAGATGRPVPWFPTTPPSPATPYLVGSVISLQEDSGRVYFTCGDRLYQLAADGRPEPAVVAALPLSPENAEGLAVVDEPAHRLFTLANGALESFDTRTGRLLFTKTYAAAFGKGNDPLGLLAVDAQTQRLYIPLSPSLVYVPSHRTLAILRLNGTLVRTLPPLGPYVSPTELVVAGSTRRLVVFGCDAPPGPSSGLVPGAVETINLDTARSLPRQPLPVLFCGPAVAGNVAVDAAAGTAVVLGESDFQPMPQPQPGLAWFINLRTGTRLQIGIPYSCVQVGLQPAALAIDSRLHRAYVTSVGDGLVTILDTRTGRVLGVVHVGGRPTGVAVDERDQRVVVALDGQQGEVTSGLPGGVAFFAADIQPKSVPPTQGCGDEVAGYFLNGWA